MQTVICHSGYRYAERPVKLLWDGQWLEVVAVEREWQSPEGQHFRVRADNDMLFELVYIEHKDEWLINLLP